jgi:hypothetical protein
MPAPRGIVGQREALCVAYLLLLLIAPMSAARGNYGGKLFSADASV